MIGQEKVLAQKLNRNGKQKQSNPYESPNGNGRNSNTYLLHREIQIICNYTANFVRKCPVLTFIPKALL
jgi:hypothetical protein